MSTLLPLFEGRSDGSEKGSIELPDGSTLTCWQFFVLSARLAAAPRTAGKVQKTVRRERGTLNVAHQSVATAEGCIMARLQHQQARTEWVHSKD